MVLSKSLLFSLKHNSSKEPKASNERKDLFIGPRAD
jgi:hypothetical protein